MSLRLSWYWHVWKSTMMFKSILNTEHCNVLLTGFWYLNVVTENVIVFVLKVFGPAWYGQQRPSFIKNEISPNVIRVVMCEAVYVLSFPLPFCICPSWLNCIPVKMMFMAPRAGIHTAQLALQMFSCKCHTLYSSIARSFSHTKKHELTKTTNTIWL